MTTYPIDFPKHDNGKPDSRYTASLEYTGYSVPLIACRFCGDLIGAAPDELKASRIMADHKTRRDRELTGGAI